MTNPAVEYLKEQYLENQRQQEAVLGDLKFDEQKLTEALAVWGEKPPLMPQRNGRKPRLGGGKKAAPAG